MGRFYRVPFNANGPFVVRAAFRLNGVTMKAGDPFYPKGLEPRKVKTLYSALKINVGEGTPEQDPSDVFDWRTLQGDELLTYASEKTGTNFRKVERAINALEDLEA